jgi:pimeloyl-ACP methyl ester carboxylesterase
MAKAMLMLLLGKRGVDKAWSAASGKAPIAGPMADYVRLIFQNFRPRREAPPIFTDAELRALSLPIQVVVGADDAMLHATQTRDRVTRLLPQAEMIWLDGAGHMLPPQTTRVADFLARVGTKNGAAA